MGVGGGTYLKQLTWFPNLWSSVEASKSCLFSCFLVEGEDEIGWHRGFWTPKHGMPILWFRYIYIDTLLCFTSRSPFNSEVYFDPALAYCNSGGHWLGGFFCIPTDLPETNTSYPKRWVWKMSFLKKTGTAGSWNPGPKGMMMKWNIYNDCVPSRHVQTIALNSKPMVIERPGW